LDLGCGQGWYASALSKQGYAVTGVDASAGQIEKAREFAQQQGLALTFHVSGASSLPFDDEKFDFAYSINVLHHILVEADRKRAFAELLRVLKPGGVFFLHEINTENPIFRLYMSYVFPLINRIDEGDERWLLPSRLPVIEGASWAPHVEFFTFLPDFLPERVSRALGPLERWLESSKYLRRFSAHFLAVLVKPPGAKVQR